MASVDVMVTDSDEHLDAAADIWAAATAARDRDTEVARLDVSRPIIEAVLDNSPRSLLVVAVDDGGDAVGFAATEPIFDEECRAELRYLGVRPDAWGQGVGAAILTALPRELQGAGFVGAELYVYTDNWRAVALYRRLGWTPLEIVRPHPRSGRREQRYALSLAG